MPGGAPDAPKTAEASGIAALEESASLAKLLRFIFDWRVEGETADERLLPSKEFYVPKPPLGHE